MAKPQAQSPALSALKAAFQTALPQAADETPGLRQPEVNEDMGQEQNVPPSTRALREVQAKRGRIY